MSVSTRDSLLCPAELLVLQRDSRRLNDRSTSSIEKSGLVRRILTTLATIPELCRRYQELSIKNPGDQSKLIQKIRELQQNKSEAGLRALDEEVRPLLTLAPFNISQFQAATKKAISEAKETYQTYCASCHQHSNRNTKNPAYSLFDMARHQEEPEFLARMLLGIRGTPEIGLSNPLTLTEIGAMRAYLLLESDNN